MGIINPALPTVGGQRGDGESALRSDVLSILNEFNGNIDTNNVRDASLRATDMDSGAVVTALPGAPYDGQEINFLADATNGIVWRFKYRAASAASSRWEFCGGAALRVEGVGGRNFGAQEGISTLAQGALTTPGPAITVPVAGDYLIEGKATHVQPSTAGAPAHFLWIPADGAITWQVADGLFSASSANNTGTVFSRRTRTLASGATVEMRYASSGAGTTVNFYDRNLWVTPIRVG